MERAFTTEEIMRQREAYQTDPVIEKLRQEIIRIYEVSPMQLVIFENGDQRVQIPDAAKKQMEFLEAEMLHYMQKAYPIFAIQNNP